MSYIVALTGGVACGKTTIANLFSNFDVPIIDADLIARQVVQPGSDAFNAIVDHFGSAILTKEGQLNRRRLRAIIFNSPTEKIWLNTLLHPLILQQTLQHFCQVKMSYLLWVVPLLIENKLMSLADRILVVELDPVEQLARMMSRDDCDEKLAQQVIAAQVSQHERRRYADDIIINEGDRAQLLSKVIPLHYQYLKLAQQKK